MSGWKNLLWEDPEEGRVYDVWINTGRRALNMTFKNGEFYNCHGHKYKVSGVTVTHYMLSPGAPED